MAVVRDEAGKVAHVETDVEGKAVYVLYENFPLGGADKPIKCLVVQPEDGSAPTRVAADSPEAARLRRRYPDVAALDGGDS